MATVSSTQARIEKVLVEAASLLVERARAQLEREVEVDASGDSSAELRRLRDLEDELRTSAKTLAMRAAMARAPPLIRRSTPTPLPRRRPATYDPGRVTTKRVPPSAGASRLMSPPCSCTICRLMNSPN